jgi:hypothetical protein
VEGVEVAAGSFSGLQCLRQQTEGGHGRLVDVGGNLVLGILLLAAHDVVVSFIVGLSVGSTRSGVHRINHLDVRPGRMTDRPFLDLSRLGPWSM